jgi:hypothetical protein
MKEFDLRNFRGAALGGTLGILMWGFVHPFTSFVGCLVGSIIGYHWKFIAEKIGRIKPIFSHRSWLRDPFVLTHRGKIIAMRFVAMAIFVGSFAAQMCIAYFTWEYQGNWLHTFSVAWLIVALCSTVVTIGCTFTERWDSYSMIGGYEDWAMWYLTPGEYLVNNVKDTFKLSFPVSLAIAAAFAWFIVAGGIFSILILAPITVVWGIIRALYQAASRGGHWSAFVVSLAITMYAGLHMSGSFGDPRMVWLVALGTGLVSGIVAEVLRLGVLWLIAAISFTRNMSGFDWLKATKSARATFMRITNAVGDISFDNAKLNRFAPTWA